MEEWCDVRDLVKNLGVVWQLYKLDKLFEDGFDVAKLFGVVGNEVVFVHQTLLLFFVFLFETYNYLLLLLVKLSNELTEPILNISQLHLHQPFKLIPNLSYENPVFIDNSLSVI